MNSWLPAVLALSVLMQGCASTPAPRPYFAEDAQGRYYETTSGHVLRVEPDGTILDIGCTDPDLARGLSREDLLRLPCSTGKVSVLGKAKRTGIPGSDWDLSGYDIEPESGTCSPIFASLSDAWAAEKRRSCAHRLWEVPAAIVAYPTLGVLIVGLATAPIWLPILILTKK